MDEDKLPVRNWRSVITLRHLCMVIGALILFEEGWQIGKKINNCSSAVNFEDEEADWCLYRDLPIILALRIPALLAAGTLVYGAKWCKSTLIAVFLWITLEVLLLYFIYIAYKEARSYPREELEIVVPIFFLKAICWGIVNVYHNKLKREVQEAKLRPFRLETAV